MKLQVANIGGGWPREWFEDSIEEACEEYPWSLIDPLLTPFSISEQVAREHWPWIAFGLASYRNRYVRGKDDRDLSPARAVSLLNEIAKHADALDEALRQMADASGAAVANGNNPKFLAFARAHRSIVSVFDDPDLTRRGELDPAGHSNFVQWKLPLYDIARTAEEAALRLGEDDGARAGSGQRLWGLSTLISISSLVWRNATGREPTAERIERKDDTGDGAPDFVVFIRSLCGLASLPSPTLSMVKTALTHQ
ncbi:MAG: hypothetical protein K0S56_1517 [Microvirga sp.]|nr:hypothetical protein [Microvirga sp.]